MIPLAVEFVITSPLSLARVLWWYGEDDLWASALALAPTVIEHLEGRQRPAVRRHRRGGPLPDVLDLGENERWHDPALAEVLRLVRERTEARADGPQPWQLPRLYGRYAPG